jgi:hypothetical protein
LPDSAPDFTPNASAGRRAAPEQCRRRRFPP